MKLKWALIFIIEVLGIEMAISKIPQGFSLINDVCPSIVIQMDYSSDENFTGNIVRGYKAKKAYMVEVAVEALCKVQKDALEKGYTLKIFDAYRPKKAVTSFGEWAKLPENRPDIKKLYYPTFTRLQLFENGYIASQSSHSKGSAIDLTLVDTTTGKELDMGSRFDYFDVISHTASNKINPEQKKNRMLLKDLMESYGFKNFSQEWWHYSYKPEPYPDTYFDFDVE